VEFRYAKQAFLTAKEAGMITERTLEFYDMWIKDFCLYAIDNKIYDTDDMSATLIEKYFIYLRKERKVKGITSQARTVISPFFVRKIHNITSPPNLQTYFAKKIYRV